MADLADQRTTEILTALEANDYSAAQRHCSAQVRAGFPQVIRAWQQVTDTYGKLESFEITGRTSVNGMDVRTANLNFEHPSGLAAQVSINADGNIAGMFFVAAVGSPHGSRTADERVTELLEALRDGKFDAAEVHFDSTMKRLLPPSALETAWKQQTGSLGDLKTWRIVGRPEIEGSQVRIVNLDFANALKAFALKVSVSASGEIGGLYFIPAQSEASSTPPSRKGLRGTPRVTIETIPKLNHLFIAGSGQPSPDEYSVPGYVAPDVIARVSSFIKQ
ncbi:MAG: hypothetical protein WA854_08060 [Candidatus Binataceae bacterium]